ALVRLDYRDGVIDRKDMLNVYTTIERDGIESAIPYNGTVTASELSDLKAMVSTKLNFQIDTRYFASRITNGDAANAHYQGAALGNLAGGGSAQQLVHLVDKWYMGGDLPELGALDNAHYGNVNGTLFQNWISNTDIDQGLSNDCYFLAALGAVARRT